MKAEPLLIYHSIKKTDMSVCFWLWFTVLLKVTKMKSNHIKNSLDSFIGFQMLG